MSSANERVLPFDRWLLPFAKAVSPFQEMGAYEAIWAEQRVTFKTIAQRLAEDPGRMPSDLVDKRKAFEYANLVWERLREANVGRFGVRVNGAAEYPEKLRDAAYPVQLLYYAGWWDLVWSRSVAVVGSRNPSRQGLARTEKLTAALVDDDFTIVSGLATGVDTVAHETAIARRGRTIAVIGTPLTKYYPRSNEALQRRIAKEFLVVSQVPVKRYEQQDYRRNRHFFPERNITMSALTEATIIVEAGKTSGTLIQARAALHQGRKLFILDNCFRRGLEWPAKLVEKGAIRVKNYGDIQQELSPAADQN